MSELYSANTPEDMDNTEARYASASPCGPGTVRYAIGQGETLFGIAKKFGTTLEDLLKANPRLNPNLYHAGETICVPDEPAANPAKPKECVGAHYTVKRGDTLYAIAQWHHVALSELTAANPGVNPEKLFIGQVLCVPQAFSTLPPEPACDGQKYQIVRGDTFYLIAQKNKTTVEALQKANSGVQPDKLTIGQIICIPSAQPSPSPLCTGAKYTIKRGDTFYAIAQLNGIALSELISANPSVNPEQLYIGQVVCIPKKEAPAPGETPCSGTQYTITRGDTFFSIAQKNGVGVAELLAANPNANPEKLYIGQVVCVPKKAEAKPEPVCDGAKYTIAKGDTFYDISVKNGVTIQDLLTVNPGVNPERLYVGQVICVPKKAAPQPTPPPPAPPAEKPCDGTKYVVVKGDTFWGISQKTGVDLTALLAANPSVSPEKLTVGQIICVPKKAAAFAPVIPADPAGPAAPVAPSIPAALAARALPEPAAEEAAEPAELAPEDDTAAFSMPVSPETVKPEITDAPEDILASTALKPCDGIRYVIQKGDTFFALAQKNGISLSELLAVNPGVNPEKLNVGDVVCVPKKAVEPPATKPCNGVRYSVQKGDTFYAIAHWNNIELADLLAANPGVNPEKLDVGQVICVPLKSGETAPGCNGHLYETVKGDTLWAIAKRNSIPINDLMAANPGVVPEKLEVGQKICVPGGGGVSPFCANGTPYVIRKGDTLYAIAIRFGLSLARVLEANPSVNPEKLVEGDIICLPDPESVTPEPLCPGGTQYVIQKGDTFYALALRYGLPLAAILAANPKVNPDALEPGDVVCLPTAGPLKPFCGAGTPYVIQKGDTLYALAIKFGVSLQEMLAANPALKPDKLEPGDIVCIPKKQEPPAPTPPPSCDGSRYVIQAGDTFFKLSQRFTVTVDQLLKANPSVDPDNLQVGQVICLPKPSTSAPPAPPAKPCKPTVYRVCCGDTLFSIAKKFGITLADLFKANPGLRPDCLLQGANVAIPCVATTMAAAVAVSAPAPVEAVEAVEPEAAKTAACLGETYTVQKGDSFYLIARRLGIELADLLSANPTVAPDKLLVGQVICLPKAARKCPEGYSSHTLSADQTYADLLVLYNLAYSALALANPDIAIIDIKEGDTVCIPSSGNRGRCSESALEPHVMVKGETLLSIAVKYGTSAAAILAANPILAPSDFVTGRIVCLPKDAKLE